MIRTARLIAWVLAIAAAGIAGCTAPSGAASTDAQAGTTNDAATKRFRDAPLEGRTAVESAIELSKEYAKLSDITVTLRQENQRLTSENENLREQVTTLDAKLKQTQKELTEANDMLFETMSELNQWKSNILGFRGEMRDAASAQLEALLKVLEILGGEAEAGAIGQRHAGTLNPDANDATSAQEPTIPQEIEPNGIEPNGM